MMSHCLNKNVKFYINALQLDIPSNERTNTKRFRMENISRVNEWAKIDANEKAINYIY